jgi:hypothetical protein
MNDTQLETVQNKIGRVQGQMKENIELVMQRQEDIDGLADKSSSLQQSASQFSQVASRVREVQQIEQYKLYAGILFGVVSLALFVHFWGSPGKLLGSLVVVGIAASIVFYLFHMRKQSSVRLAETALNRPDFDMEKGIIRSGE